MEIKEKLKSMGIKKILVTDDTLENLQAAKQYFNSLDIKTQYASSSQESIKMIQEAYVENHKYDLVLTDLEMETKNSGIGVVKKALETIAYATLITGRNYNAPDNASHGPNTMVLPIGESMNGRKSMSDIWEFALEKSLEYVSSEEIQLIYKSAKRYLKFIGKIPDIFVKHMLEEYN